MSATTLPIKNMICHRCVMVVENILKKENINYQVVLFGEIHPPKPSLQNEKFV